MAAEAHQQELEQQQLEEQMRRARKLQAEWLDECRVFDEHCKAFHENMRMQLCRK